MLKSCKFQDITISLLRLNFSNYTIVILRINFQIQQGDDEILILIK